MVIIIPLLVSLATACQTRIALFSTPSGAAIYSGTQKLGQTPLRMDEDVLERNRAAGGYLLRMEKEGYSRIWILVPDSQRTFEMQVKLRQFAAVSVLDKGEGKSTAGAGMSSRELKAEGPKVARAFQKDVMSLLRIQTAAISGGAINQLELKRVMDLFPDSGTPYFVDAIGKAKGQDLLGASKSISEALRRNPYDVDFMAMRRMLPEEK